MTGDEFRAARADAGMSIRAAADHIGASTRTIQAWERMGSAELPPHAANLLKPRVAEGVDVDRANYVLGQVMACVERAIYPFNLRQSLFDLMAKSPYPIGFGQLMQRYYEPDMRRTEELDARIAEALAHFPSPDELGPSGTLPASPSLWLGYYHEREDRIPDLTERKAARAAARARGEDVPDDPELDELAEESGDTADN